MFAVVRMSVCPTYRLTSNSGTPAARRKLAATCRASCGVSDSSASGQTLTQIIRGPLGSGFVACFHPHALSARERVVAGTSGNKDACSRTHQ